MRWDRPILFSIVLTLALPAFAGSTQTRPSLHDVFPNLQLLSDDLGIQRIYGHPFSYGDTPTASAENFLNSFSSALGLDAAELTAGNPFNDTLVQPVMVDPQTGTPKFMLVYYRQVKDGLPVYNAEVRFLTRNEPGYPLVEAIVAVRPIVHDFAVDRSVADAPSVAAGHAAVLATYPDFVNFSAAQTVIWAGTQQLKVTPCVAVTFVADNGLAATTEYAKRRFVTDAVTGAVLVDENMILSADITGNVSGYATSDMLNDACATEELVPLPYARVTSGTTTVYADVNGDFVLPTSGTTAVSVSSMVRGMYFVVNNQATTSSTLTQSVTPPGPVSFVHNSSDAEYTTAEVNGYIQANNVRSMALAANPSYPTIYNQTAFPVNVNLNDTCNAYYDYSSINFFRAGDGCNNTAFGDVIHHEYGHHLVNSGGSGQEAYGEGMADCVGISVTGRSQLALGFQSCSSGIRNADNTYQYPCTGEIHECGQLLSGCYWDLREELQVTEPANWDKVARDLFINSILLHTGSSITPSITTDVLTLDDDNGDLSDGTPHEAEIVAAFGAHNMIPQPPPANDDAANAIAACPGTSYAGSTASATNDGSASCASSTSSPDVWYSYTPTTNGTLTVSLCSGTSYDAAISVHSGAPGTTTNQLACDDDACGTGSGGETSASVTAGNTYYIRVTGYSGASGAYTLTLSGPDCGGVALTLSLPSGTPSVIAPNQPANITVQIEDGEEAYQPGSGQLHYRYDGINWQTTPLVAAGGNLYTATLPAATCEDTPEFYFSAAGNGGTTVNEPLTAPASVYTAIVGNTVTAFADNGESDLGWAVTGNATDGQWDRGAPVNCDRGDPTSDYDGSGQCFLTDNSAADSCNSDVDGGATILTSPAIDLSGLDDATVEYAVWYRNDTGSNPGADVFNVYVSNDGANWYLTDTLGPTTSAGWSLRSFQVADFVTPSATVYLRFEASDAGDGSIIEAGVDAIRVMKLSCESAPAPCPGDANCDGAIDFFDIDPFVAALTGEAAWQAYLASNGYDNTCDYVGNNDCNNDGAVDFFDIDPFVTALTSGATCP